MVDAALFLPRKEFPVPVCVAQLTHGSLDVTPAQSQLIVNVSHIEIAVITAAPARLFSAASARAWPTGG